MDLTEETMLLAGRLLVKERLTLTLLNEATCKRI